jgi:hypothetical protein
MAPAPARAPGLRNGGPRSWVRVEPEQNHRQHKPPPVQYMAGNRPRSAITAVGHASHGSTTFAHTIWYAIASLAVTTMVLAMMRNIKIVVLDDPWILMAQV